MSIDFFARGHRDAFAPPRRRFVGALAAGSGLAGLGLWPAADAAAASGNPNVLSGTEFDLTVAP